MVLDILNILEDYHYRKKFADEKFVLKVCAILNKHYELDKYIKYVVILHGKNEKGSRYSFTHNVLYINMDKICPSEFKKTLKENYYGMYNLMAVKIITHEFEHALQERIKDSDDNTIERKILLLGDPTTFIDINNYDFTNKIQWLKYYQFYSRHYDIAPNERLAIIKSSLKLNSLCQRSFIIFSPYYSIFFMDNTSDINYILPHGYKLHGENTISPTLWYLNKLTKENRSIIKKDLSLMDFNIPSEDRLLYGLPLTKDEFNNINNVKKSLIKKYGGKYE